MYEYLPAFLGDELPEYDGYKLDTHPGITHAFQSSAFRFGHTMIPPGIYRRDGKCNYRKTHMGNPALRLCAHWWDSGVSLKLNLLLVLSTSQYISKLQTTNNILSNTIEIVLFLSKLIRMCDWFLKAGSLFYFRLLYITTENSSRQHLLRDFSGYSYPKVQRVSYITQLWSETLLNVSDLDF